MKHLKRTSNYLVILPCALSQRISSFLNENKLAVNDFFEKSAEEYLNKNKTIRISTYEEYLNRNKIIRGGV